MAEVSIKKYIQQLNRIKKLEKINRTLLRENNLLKKRLVHSKIKTKTTKRKTFRAKIYFSIKSTDEKSELLIFEKIYNDLIKIAEEDKVKLEFKIKKGSLDVVAIIVIPLILGVVGNFVTDAIKKILARVKDSPNAHITKLDSATQERLARQLHEDLGRSIKGIIERKSIRIDGIKGKEFTIRDNNNVDWKYRVLDNGDYRSL